MARRRRRAAASTTIADDYFESPAPPPPSESLVRAAELGLAEMTDLSREPREAIIACYAAMERELANVPDAVPQAFDTATEVLARAVEHDALHADNARAAGESVRRGAVQPTCDEREPPRGGGARASAGPRRACSSHGRPERRMKRLIALGVCLIVGIELLALILQDRRFVLAGAGVAVALVLLNIRRLVGHQAEPQGRREARRPGRRAAALAVHYRDDDPMVGVDAGGLGPASASDARTALRNRHRPWAGEGPGGVPRHRPNAVRRRIVGMGRSEQRHAYR